MIELKKDKKSPTWIVTTTDSEGFHRQLNISESDLEKLVRMWEESRANDCTNYRAHACANDCTIAPNKSNISNECEKSNKKDVK